VRNTGTDTGGRELTVANQLGAGASGGSASPDRAEVMLAEARKAFFVMVAFIALIWALQIANWADHYGFDASYGIIPRDVLRLPDIFLAPFLHFSWGHIEANSGPLFVFGFLAAYRGVWKFAGVTVLVIVTSGLAAWFFQSQNTVGVGASGLVFGYFGYVLARGLIDRNLIDALVAIVMGLSFAYLLTVAVPGTPNVSWLAHLGGLIGGLAAGWIFRTRRAKTGQKPKRAADTGTGKSAGTGGGTRPLPVAPDNPRADLHKELGELGL
jgi:membrane associated rhomboid family serine protease